MSHELEESVFTNTSTRPCLLRGYPTITALTEQGTRVPLRPERDGTFFGRLFPADLRPGGHVLLDLSTGAACDGGTRLAVHYHALVFTLPQGGQVWGGRVRVFDICGLSMSTFGLPERWVEPTPAPGTAGTLEVAAQFPQVVRRGRTLHFTVALTNPTSVTVTLKPCPGYTLGINDGTVHERSLSLNCDSVHTIRPHQRVRYSMQLRVPRRPKLNIAKLFWSLNTPTGPFAGTGSGITT